jgi:hypothetical protein
MLALRLALASSFIALVIGSLRTIGTIIAAVTRSSTRNPRMYDNFFMVIG